MLPAFLYVDTSSHSRFIYIYMLGWLATMRQQQRNLLDYGTTAFEVALQHQPALSLPPPTVTISGKSFKKAA
jgi:hypothetical protein